MAVLIAGTILTSMFLPQDQPHMNRALEGREGVVHGYAAFPLIVAGEGVERWRGLVEQYFKPEDVEQYFKPEDVAWAMAVMQCESQGDPMAKNPTSTASGLFQHLASYWQARSAAAGWAGASIWDPEANVAVAAWLVGQKGGKNHWTCTRKVEW